MMLKGAKTADEFYVAPAYNELILDGKRITTFGVDRSQMYSLGTPEDLEVFTKWVGQADSLPDRRPPACATGAEEYVSVQTNA
jgi:hypothetical protein